MGSHMIQLLRCSLQHHFKPAFIPNHKNATNPKSANDSTTAPRSVGFAYKISILAPSTGSLKHKRTLDLFPTQASVHVVIRKQSHAHLRRGLRAWLMGRPVASKYLQFLNFGFALHLHMRTYIPKLSQRAEHY